MRGMCSLSREALSSWTISCFPPSFTYLSIQGFDAFSQHLTPKPNETIKKTYPLFEWNISQKYLTLELCQTQRLALILKGHWIPNTMDPCGSHFPIKDLGGGDCLQTVRNWLRCVFGVWQLPDPSLCPLITRDFVLSGRCGQSSRDLVVMQPVSFGCVYSQPSCRQSVAMTLGEQQLLFQVNIWCFVA